MSRCEKRIEDLFAVFAVALHLKFTMAFPTPQSVEAAKQVWQRGLSDLSDKEIVAGANALANYEGAFFPTLSEFKNLICPRIKNESVAITDQREFKPASQAVYKKNMSDILLALKKCSNSKSVRTIQKRLDEPYFVKD